MAPVYGNMTNLCLVCANARDVDDEPFLDINGQRGKLLKISDKIRKFLTIKIEPGFPHHVCISCVCKLELFHEFVQSSENAYGKLKTLQGEWEARQMSEALEEPMEELQSLQGAWKAKQMSEAVEEPMEDVEDTLSQIDVYIPSPECQEQKNVHLDHQKVQTEPQPKKKRASKSIIEILEKNQEREFPMLQQPFLVVKGSQLSFFVALEDAEVKYQYRLGLAVINMGAEQAKNQMLVTEKVIRVNEHIKKRFTTKEDKGKSSTNKLLHSCQNCRCSFFLQEEMLSHFESLHPEEVHQCSVCDEKICGPVSMQEKHMELHRALEEGQTDELLSSLGVPVVSPKVFHPEFFLVELGDYKPHFLQQKTDTILQSKFLSTIRGNVWIKPDMKDRLSHFLEIFISKIKLHLNKVQKPKVSQATNSPRVRIRTKVTCDVCGKEINKKYLESHINRKHNPENEKVQCSHCKIKYLRCNENSHIELHHNGGNTILCKICDSKFSETGENQPHMTPKSNFPFKCPTKRCRKAFQSEENLEKHMQMIHKESTPCLCDLCGKQYKDKNNLKSHLRTVHFPRSRDTLYTCEICGATYRILSSFRRHKLIVHEPKATCEICGVKVNKYHLENHMKVHTRKPSIPCKYCGRLFTTILNCTLHEQKRHEGVKLYCSICTGLAFKSVQSLEKHKLKHELGEEIILPKNLRPVQCPICSEMLGNSSKLSLHMRRHKKTGNNGILPKKQTRRKETSREDFRNRGFTFPCYACLIRFMTQESYDQHLETHHPDGAPNIHIKPPDSDFRYQCRYCEKTFRKKDFCNDHETLHGGEKQHACNYCGKKFSYYCDKWAHQNRKCPKRPQTSSDSN